MVPEQITKRPLASRLRRLWAAWIAVQVEFHGRYSVERLHQLGSYMKSLGYTRLVAVCLLSPLPCLISSVLIELVPLAAPEEGAYANWVFFIRVSVVTCWMVGSMTLQMGQNTPRLEVKTRHAVVIGVLTGITTSLTLFGVGAVSVFPVPFGMLVASPPCVIVLFSCCAYVWGSRWEADPLLRTEVKQQMMVLACQVSLTYVYPLYIYGFVSLAGVYQALFVIVLPIIKLIAKNWISRALGDRNDLKPEEVTFNVEIFNALYVANALQRASSLGVTAIIMGIDLVHFWISLIDVAEVFNDVKVLMDKIPQGHPMANANFVQVAEHLLNAESKSWTRRHPTTTSITRKESRIESWVESGRKLSKAFDTERQAVGVIGLERAWFGNNFQIQLRWLSRKIFPVGQPQCQVLAPTGGLKGSARAITDGRSGLDTIFSRSERALFVHKSARVLFILEYLVLIEYVEVVLPVVYCLHRVILFHLPNSAYYPSLANSSSTEVLSSTLNLLGYGALEFTSLIVTLVMLKRILGFSSLSQLTFVLDKQANKVQTKMTILFVYMMELSLVHLGSDLSFKFDWICPSSGT